MKTLKFLFSMIMLVAVAFIIAKFQWVLIIGSFAGALAMCATKTLKLKIKGDK